MPTNDPVLEVLREMRGDLVLVTTELGRLVRHAEYTNARLDEHGQSLREHGQTLREHGQTLREHERILERQDARLQSIDRRLETIDDRVDSLERNAVATVAALELLHAGVQAIVPALEQGRLRDDRLHARVDECERSIDALKQEP